MGYGVSNLKTQNKDFYHQIYLVYFRRFFCLKVSLSQKQFFFKLHCPKNERNIRQNSAPAARAEFYLIFCLFFGVMEFQEKMLLRFTDL
jgi:hypothetical protein